MRQQRKDKIRAFLARSIYEARPDVVMGAAKHFGLSRQTIHRHLAAMVDEGILEASGKTRSRVYTLKMLEKKRWEFDLQTRPAEDFVWREHLAQTVSALPKNVRDICQYGFTEMFNNAVEHSEGKHVYVGLERTFEELQIIIADDGIGIFTKIKKGLGLSTEREAILELTKGKVTTDPTSHSGEGIFFTSRAFEDFSILSGTLFFSHKGAAKNDWFMDSKAAQPGTFVSMSITSDSKLVLQKVFDKYISNVDEPAFDSTRVPVGFLCIEGQNVVSRSQAKRLMAGMHRFKHVTLDFKNVDDIGQAFADEVFRVYKNQNPEVSVIYDRANEQVEKMIKRAIATARENT